MGAFPCEEFCARALKDGEHQATSGPKDTAECDPLFSKSSSGIPAFLECWIHDARISVMVNGLISDLLDANA
jgi:hypothetical protein